MLVLVQGDKEEIVEGCTFEAALGDHRISDSTIFLLRGQDSVEWLKLV